MKKLIAVGISILLLMTCFTIALAEGTIDFSSYSLEELLEIRSDLADEIASRPGGEKMVLGSGQYKIGEDLPAGVYTSCIMNPFERLFGGAFPVPENTFQR